MDSDCTDDSSVNNLWYDSWLFSILNTNSKYGSLHLLNADFYSYMLFKRLRFLKGSALGVSRRSNIIKSDKAKYLINFRAKEWKEANNKFNPLINENEFFNFENFNVSYVSTPIINRHNLLEGFVQLKFVECTEERYNRLFYDFEDYVIKLFSIHPTLGSSTRGVFLEDDGSMISSCLNYIRFYESALHLLSQKLHHHFYLTLFVLIVLLRNIRRLMHHYKTNSTFFEFIMIMIEGINMCQNHLYNTFLSDKRIFRSQNDECIHSAVSQEFRPRTSSARNISLKLSLESIKLHNDECNNYKNDIHNICKDEKLKSQLDSKLETTTGYEHKGASDGDTAMDDYEVNQVEDSEALRILCQSTYPMMTKREDYFDSSLDYDKSEIFHLLYLNVVLDCEIAKWISELCKLSSIYCELGSEPILLQRRFSKLVIDSGKSVIPMLCTMSFTNLSAARSIKVKHSNVYKGYRTRKNRDTVRQQSKTRPHEQSESKPVSLSTYTPQSGLQSERTSPSESVNRDQLERPQLFKQVEQTDESVYCTSSEQVTPVNNPITLPKVSKPVSSVKVKPKTPKQKKSSRSVEKPKKSKYQKWNLDEVQLFIKALNTYGDGKWRHIEQMYFLGKKSQAQLKDKWVNLVKFGHIKKVEIPRENGTIGSLWVPVESPARHRM